MDLRDEPSFQPGLREHLAGDFEASAYHRRDVDQLAPAADNDADGLVDPDLGPRRRLLEDDPPLLIAVAELDPLFLERESFPGELALGLGQGLAREIGYRDDFPPWMNRENRMALERKMIKRMSKN